MFILNEDGTPASKEDFEYFKDEAEHEINVILPDYDDGYLVGFDTWTDYGIWDNQK